MLNTLSTKPIQLTHKNKLLWHLTKTPSGEMKLIPIEPKSVEPLRGGTIHATLLSKTVKNKKTQQVADELENAGGSVVSLRGRYMTIEVDGHAVEQIGDILDSFGCQWDFDEE